MGNLGSKLGLGRSKRGHQDYPLQDLDKEPPVQIKSADLQPELRQLVLWFRDGCLVPEQADHADFALPAAQFAQFEAYLHGDGELGDMPLRYEYDGDLEVLTIRLPLLKHELVVTMLARRLRVLITALHHHAQPFVAALASSLGSPRAGVMRYPSTVSTRMTRRAPDVDIRSTLGNGAVPVVAGEVSLSQTAKSVQTRCNEYIQRTRGATRTVFAVHSVYPEGKIVRLSVWRAKFDKDGNFQGVNCDENVVIRSHDGAKNPDNVPGIVLSLDDFCPVEITPRAVDLKSIAMIVPTDEILEIMEYAEEQREAEKRKREDKLRREDKFKREEKLKREKKR